MKKYRLFQAVLFVLLSAMLGSAVSVRAAGPVCSLSADDEIIQGKAFDISLRLENSPAVAAAEAELVFDSSLFRLIKAELPDKKINDVFAFYENSGKVRLVLAQERASSGVTVKLRFAPLINEVTEFSLRVTDLSVTSSGKELVKAETLPQLTVSVQSRGEARKSSVAASSSKEEKQTSNKSSSERSRASSQTKTSKESSAKKDAGSESTGSRVSDGATAETASDEEPSANTYYFRDSREDQGAGQTVFLAAAGTAVIVVLVAMVFFGLGRRSSRNDKNK